MPRRKVTNRCASRSTHHQGWNNHKNVVDATSPESSWCISQRCTFFYKKGPALSPSCRLFTLWFDSICNLTLMSLVGFWVNRSFRKVDGETICINKVRWSRLHPRGMTMCASHNVVNQNGIRGQTHWDHQMRLEFLTIVLWPVHSPLQWTLVPITSRYCV